MYEVINILSAAIKLILILKYEGVYMFFKSVRFYNED